jgi:hypothetical protein
MISCAPQWAAWMITSWNWGRYSSGFDMQGWRLISKKCSFFAPEIEYPGYALTREGIKHQPKKVKAILVLTPPQNVQQLCRFLDKISGRDIVKCCPHAPIWLESVGTQRLLRLTTPNKSREIGTVCIRLHATKWRQQSPKILSWPILTTCRSLRYILSKFQRGGVITQSNRLLVFFNRKLNKAQQNTARPNRNYWPCGNTGRVQRHALGWMYHCVHQPQKPHVGCSRVHLWLSLPLEITLGGILPHHCVCKRDPQHGCRCHFMFGLRFCH